MADSTETVIERRTEEGTGDMTETIPRGAEDDVTPSRSKVYPLNSPKLTTDVIRKIATQLELTGSGSKADTLSMVEGKLRELGHEPRNTQVRVTGPEGHPRTLKLLSAEGSFLTVELTSEDDEGEEGSGSGTEEEPGTGAGAEELGELRAQLEEVRSQNKNLQTEVSELSAKLNKANARVKELWGQQCDLLCETDTQVATLEAEVERLQTQLTRAGTTSVEPERRHTRAIEPSTPGRVGDRASSRGSQRRGKAPPVEPFSGENAGIRLEDWLPTWEIAAAWNEWSDADRLLQLAGHLRGKARLEWDLISETDKATFAQAVEALRGRLDPGSKTLAARDFRHTNQREKESVSDYICRLERNLHIAYGRGAMNSDAKETLLYGQIHAGLRLELIQAPDVSGVDSYTALQVAAKSEEHRLQEIEKRVSYSKQGKLPKGPPGSAGKATSNRDSNRDRDKGHESKGSAGKGKCFVCDKPGHFAVNCPSKRTESSGKASDKSTSKSSGKSVSSTNKTSRKDVKQVQASEEVCESGAESEDDEDQEESAHESCDDTESGDLMGLLLSDSDSDRDRVSLVQVPDEGSSARTVKVQVQGVQAVGVIDSGSDITIMGAELFGKVALVARLRKRDFKKADITPKTYDQRPFTLDGRLELDIEFAGKSIHTPVYVWKQASDQLLLSEGVCRQLGIITYHPEVKPCKQLAKSSSQVHAKEAQVPMVRVQLIQAVNVLQHQSIAVPVSVDEGRDSERALLLEPVSEFSSGMELHVEESLIDPKSDGLAYLCSGVQS